MLVKLQNILKIDKAVGPVVLPSVNVGALNDTERIIFSVLNKRLTYLLGFADKETVSVDDVQKEVKSKSVGALISQMIPQKLIQNMAEVGKKGEYRITDYGITWFISKVLPKLEENKVATA